MCTLYLELMSTYRDVPRSKVMDGRYVVNASRCDVWVVCARLPVCIVACFVGFWGSVFFAGSAFLHDCFLHFKFGKCFFCNFKIKL